MLTLRCSQQLRTSRHLKGFRSCRTSTGWSRRRAAGRQLVLAEVALANRELRRQWLAQHWAAHRQLLRVLRQVTAWEAL